MAEIAWYSAWLAISLAILVLATLFIMLLFKFRQWRHKPAYPRHTSKVGNPTDIPTLGLEDIGLKSNEIRELSSHSLEETELPNANIEQKPSILGHALERDMNEWEFDASDVKLTPPKHVTIRGQRYKVEGEIKVRPPTKAEIRHALSDKEMEG